MKRCSFAWRMILNSSLWLIIALFTLWYILHWWPDIEFGLLLLIDATVSQAIISHYPLEAIGVDEEKARLQRVTVETPNGVIQLWHIHAYRANFLPFGPNLLSYGSDFVEHQRYAGQYRWLADQTSKVDSPLILAGDFNISYLSTPFRMLTAHLSSTHQVSGQGLGLTFPATPDHGRWFTLWGRIYRISSPIRLVRLDHILVSPHFYVENAVTLQEAAGSDHAPILAKLFWKTVKE